MLLYILDSTFKEVQLVDRYESLIWTERFSTPGNVEVIVLDNQENKELLRVGTNLGINLSPRVMVIETVESSVSDEGIRLLKIIGSSLESILQRRVAREYLNILDDNDVWVFNDKKPAEIMRSIFDKICVQGVLSSKDKIPYVRKWAANEERIYPEGDIPEPSVNTTREFGVKTVAEAFKQMIDAYPTLGYRLYRRFYNPGELYFEVYTGSDRTLMQNNNTPVVFSLPWGTLDSYSDFDSVEEYANVAYVFSKYGYAVVDDAGTSGFDRRVINLVVNDETSEHLRSTQLKRYLEEKGREALADAKRTALFEGEIPDNSPYEYMRDYFLGDYIDLIGEGGVGARMVVVENIFVSDKNGYRSYPTFRMDEHISPDTWSGLRGGKVWSLMPGYWGTYSGEE